MGLTDSYRSTRPGTWGVWGVRVFAGSFFASLMYALVNVAIRGIQFSIKDNSPLVPAFVAGTSFAVLSLMTATVFGGFLYWTQSLALWVIGTIAYFCRADHRYLVNGTVKRERLFASASKFVRNLDYVTMLWHSVACILGILSGALLAWGITDGFEAVHPNFDASVYAPGQFGMPDPNVSGRALMTEVVGATFISAVVTYFMLINKPILAAMAGGFTTFISTLIAFNVSGGAFDAVYWVMHNTAVCIAGTACFNDAGEFWWVYIGGDIGGAFIGVLLALIVFQLSPFERDATMLPANSNVGTAGRAIAVAQQQYASGTGTSAGTDSQHIAMVADGGVSGTSAHQELF